MANSVQTFDISDTIATAGQPLNVGRFIEKSIQLVLTSGSYLIQVSNDGNTWEDIGAARTGSELVTTQDATPLPLSVEWIRIFTTTVGDLVAKLAGHTSS